MSEKSHVTLIQRFCLNCGRNYDTGELGLANRFVNGELEKRFDKYTVVGPGLCPDCTEKLSKDEMVQVYAVKRVGKDQMEVVEAFVIKENFLRDICNDLPELPDHVLQCSIEAAKQIRHIAEEVVAGVKAKLEKDAEYEKRGWPES